MTLPSWLLGIIRLDKMVVEDRGGPVRLPERFRAEGEFLSRRREAVFVPA